MTEDDRDLTGRAWERFAAVLCIVLFAIGGVAAMVYYGTVA